MAAFFQLFTFCIGIMINCISGVDALGVHVGAGEEVAGGGLQSRNFLHSGNFPERTIGNLGSFSDLALLNREKLLQPPPPKFLVLRLWVYMQLLL